jgi:hypothetical protein
VQCSAVQCSAVQCSATLTIHCQLKGDGLVLSARLDIGHKAGEDRVPSFAECINVEFPNAECRYVEEPFSGILQC